MLDTFLLSLTIIIIMFNQLFKNINSSIESFPIPILASIQQQQPTKQTNSDAPQEF